MVNLFKALADENRLRILNLLYCSELCVCEIETLLELTQTNVSRHLGKLRAVNLIKPFKKAQWAHYQLSSEFKQNELLYAFLQNRFQSESTFLKDTERLHRYKENELNCSLIRNDKENVLKIIQGEND
ncbi:MAG: winged helix-turn-helix transcriptional regulator [Candidatus Cloacimonetes bacterium]|nr:winged helix-turn-helix transcriptional regulator [Candidatus Cloacimonadota bacterium]